MQSDPLQQSFQHGSRFGSLATVHDDERERVFAILVQFCTGASLSMPCRRTCPPAPCAQPQPQQVASHSLPSSRWAPDLLILTIRLHTPLPTHGARSGRHHRALRVLSVAPNAVSHAALSSNRLTQHWDFVRWRSCTCSSSASTFRTPVAGLCRSRTYSLHSNSHCPPTQSTSGSDRGVPCS